MKEALDIQVKGIVQGVGFRPFVYRLAKKYLVDGWVLNATDGVFIHAEAESKLLDEFVLELSENPPAASRVEEIDLAEVPLEGFDSFEIRFSDAGAVEKTTLVSPDLATCDDCVRELFNPNDRRFRYPFINCTNCGPRFTIIEKLPYDRKSTSMKDFPMCERCAAEYADPLDRRVHAQPDACFECGPHISWREHENPDARTCTDAQTNVSRETFGAQDEEDGRCEANDHGETTGRGGVGECCEADVRGATDDRGAQGERCGTGERCTANDRGATGDRGTTGVRLGAPCGPVDAPLGPLSWGVTREQSDAIFSRAVELLMAGKILAVKGLGGFHLACDANNAEAVARLRARKRREGKAFAVMMPDLAAVRQACEVGEAEEAALIGAQRPIVLLRKRAGAVFAPGLADALPELGVMLPYTPVQHLLLHDFATAAAAAGRTDVPMLVMTSGNLHDEPIVIDDEDAYVRLFSVADAFMGHDRAIRTRYDDSVIRVIRAGSAGEAVQFVRRARGYAPLPVPLACQPAKSANAAASPSVPPLEDDGSAASSQRPSIFAAGPEQKATFALTRDAEAFVSQHIGDMENAETYDAWLAAKERFEALFEIKPNLVACDRHPEYLSAKWAHAQNLPVIEVQHHHAHVASVMAENGLTDPVCGIAFDGTGFGMDGAIWGGEVLLANRRAFERFANFAYVPLPGGAAAVRHPLRMAYGALWAFDLLDHPGAARALEALGEQAAICNQMIEQGVNTPMTSSVGRLFDAASALLGICVEPAYEGEPAILLEAAISAPPVRPLPGRAPAGPGTAPAAPSAAAIPAHAPGTAPAGPSAAAIPTAAPAGPSNRPLAAPANGQANVSRETFADDQAKQDDAAALDRYAVAVLKNTATAQSTAQDTSVLLLDAAPTFRALLDDFAAGVPVSVIARRFHDAFVQAVVTVAELVRALHGIGTVTLSGGVFMNRYLAEHAIAALEDAGFTVAVNRDLPPNDGSVSFGQAVVAWAASEEGAAESGA